jgi:hypothetical protein
VRAFFRGGLRGNFPVGPTPELEAALLGRPGLKRTREYVYENDTAAARAFMPRILLVEDEVTVLDATIALLDADMGNVQLVKFTYPRVANSAALASTVHSEVLR